MRLSVLVLAVGIGSDQLSLSQSLVDASKPQESKNASATSEEEVAQDNAFSQFLKGVDLRRSRLKTRLDQVKQQPSDHKSVKAFVPDANWSIPSSPLTRSALTSMAQVPLVTAPGDAWDELSEADLANRRLAPIVSTSGLISDFSRGQWRQFAETSNLSQAARGKPTQGIDKDALMRGAMLTVQQTVGLSNGVRFPAAFVISIPAVNREIKATYNENVRRYVFDMKLIVPFRKQPVSNGVLPAYYQTSDGKPWFFSRFEYKVDLDCDGDSTGWQYLPSSQRSDVSIVGFDFSPVRAFKSGNTWLQQRDACITVRARGVDSRGSLLGQVVESAVQRVTLKAPDSNPFIMIGMGDSYGSGEGNPYSNTISSRTNLQWWQPSAFGDFGAASRDPFLEQTAEFCHRSSESGVGKAARALYDGNKQTGLTMGFAHVACSGATSRKFFEEYAPNFQCDVCRNGYVNMPGLGPSFNRNNERMDARDTYRLSGTHERAYLDADVDPQLFQATWWAHKHYGRTGPAGSHVEGGSLVDAVVVSIGGNDAKFTQFIKDCVILDKSCHDEEDTLRNFDLIPYRIKSAVYWISGGIQQQFPNAKIYFTSYIDPIGKRGGSGVCSEQDLRSSSEYPDDAIWDVTQADARFLKAVIEDINRAIREQVSQLNEWSLAGSPGQQAQIATYLESRFPDTAPQLYRPRPLMPNVAVIEDQYTNHRDHGFCLPERRVMMFSDEAGPVQGFDQLDIWSSGGFHPNDYGYSLYAASMVQVLKESHGFRRSWPSPVPATPTYAWVEN